MGTLHAAGLDAQDEPTKHQFPKKTARATAIPRPPLEKFSARRIQVYCVCFCNINVWSLIFETSENRVPTEIDTVDVDSPRRTPVCRGLGPFRGASVRTGMDFQCS